MNLLLALGFFFFAPLAQAKTDHQRSAHQRCDYFLRRLGLVDAQTKQSVFLQVGLKIREQDRDHGAEFPFSFSGKSYAGARHLYLQPYIKSLVGLKLMNLEGPSPILDLSPRELTRLRNRWRVMGRIAQASRTTEDIGRGLERLKLKQTRILLDGLVARHPITRVDEDSLAAALREIEESFAGSTGEEAAELEEVRALLHRHVTSAPR